MAGVLIANPFASRVTESGLAAVEAVLPAGTETILTEARGEATTIAHELGASIDAVYAFGGDGTYNEVLNGLVRDVPVGFIPGGGTSVLPRALGLPRDPVEAARRIARGTSRRISLGRASGRRFAFSAGVGLDAELVRRVDERGRAADGRRPGDAAFARAALAAFAERRGRFEPQLEIEGLGRAAFAFVANCSPYTFAGPVGLRIAPDASFAGGLDVVAPVSVRARSLPALALAVVRGARGGGNVLVGHDLDRIAIRCDAPMPAQVDGEDVGDVAELALEAERDAVTVLV